MSSQLDILALEPFYGGVRRLMLETLTRCSRHRWTILKLPPRRIERRLSAAAHWFAEQLSRTETGNIDLLFTSEAMSLADLFHLVPGLAKKPSVVYFHDNQLPDPEGRESSQAHDLVNLSTGMAASELWFNSTYHLKMVMHRASAMVQKHQELASRNPVPELMRKSRLLPPPLDIRLPEELRQGHDAIVREPRVIFVETAGADMRLLNSGLATLRNRGQHFELLTVGPVKGLSGDYRMTALPESEDDLLVPAMMKAGIFLSTHREPAFDYHAVRAMAVNCVPILPANGFYEELIPDMLRRNYLYDLTPDEMASQIQDAWHLKAPEGAAESLRENVKAFDAMSACRAMDERISGLVAKQT